MLIGYNEMKEVQKQESPTSEVKKHLFHIKLIKNGMFVVPIRTVIFNMCQILVKATSVDNDLKTNLT